MNECVKCMLLQLLTSWRVLLQLFTSWRVLLQLFTSWRALLQLLTFPGFTQFLAREVLDTFPQLVDNGLRMLLQLLTSWRNATQPSASSLPGSLSRNKEAANQKKKEVRWGFIARTIFSVRCGYHNIYFVKRLPDISQTNHELITDFCILSSY